MLSAPEEEPSADLQLREIYSRETQVNIAAVHALRRMANARAARRTSSAKRPIAPATRLSGSSRMAEARHGIRLTAPLEHWVRKSFDSGVGLEAADLDLLADCMNAMQSVASHLDESTGFFQSHSALLARIEQATEKLEQRIVAAARAAEARGRASSRAAAPPVSVAPAVAAPPASFPRGSVARAQRAAPPVADVVEDVLDRFRPGHRQHLHR